MRETGSKKGTSGSPAKKWKIRHQLKPDDVDTLVHIHGILYAREYGFDETFEKYVADGLAEFVRSPKPEKSRIWLAEAGDRVIGCIAIVAGAEPEAQLRWFLVDRDYRGLGLGRELMENALLFCREQGFETVFLWTTSGLSAARRIYMRFGFRKTEEKTHKIWGKEVMEERYDLHL
jgi:ribosomal protein S18 acetylase RimI-like enzyme